MPRSVLPVDPARHRILALQDKARAAGTEYNPTPNEFREVLIAACEKAGGVEAWAKRLGCKPGVLRSVLEGRRRPQGCMLDTLGLEYVPALGRYADPQLDRRANAVWRVRMAKQLGFA